MDAYSIAGINRLPKEEKREIFTRLIPQVVFDKFQLNKSLIDSKGNDLFYISGETDSQDLVLAIFHEYGFQDPILYCHLADTLTGQIEVMLYVLNNPNFSRFDVDKMPDGSPTKFGTEKRNLEAERAAMAAGLFPGQIRKGLNILREAVDAFEELIEDLQQTMYFIQPLYYHNAIIFERYGYSYQSGRKRMEAIHKMFTEDEELITKLDGSDFRNPKARESIFYRSWAIHDGILDEPFDYIKMYKVLGKKAKINTAPGIGW